MNSNLFKFISACLLSGSLSQAALPLKIDGRYKQTGACRCMEYSETNNCAVSPLAIQAIGNYSIGGILGSGITGETIVDPTTGLKKDITVWLYELPKKNSNQLPDELRVREGDQLLYDVVANPESSGYTFAIHNLTLPQETYFAKLIIPRDQAGGLMDGPADIKTVVTANSLIHTHTTRAFTAGDESAGPPIPNPIPGVIINHAYFSITKVNAKTIVLTQIYDNRIQKKDFPVVKYHYDYLACTLKKVN